MVTEFDEGGGRGERRPIGVVAGIAVPAVSFAKPFGVRLFTHALAFSQAGYLRES